MPQTAPFRAPRAGMDRRSRGRAFARLARLLALCCGLAGAALAHAQAADGQIYIAGPGDRGGADAARMSAMLAAPGSGAAATNTGGNPAAHPTAYPAYPQTSPAALARPATPSGASDEAQNGMITIPGPGERAGAGASAADAPQVVTIPAPGTALPTSAPAAGARYGANALPRVNVGAAATRVAPVVVEASGTSAPAASHAAYEAANARAAAVQRYAAAVAGANAGTNAAASSPRAAPLPQSVASAPAQPVPAGQEDGETIRKTALAFLQQQSVGLPGKVAVTVSPVFPRGLAACDSLEPFMPPGARSWGQTTVGIRCVGAKPWTLYVSARVTVDVTYYVSGRQIEPGETLSVADLVPREADLASLPRTVVTDPSQAAGALALLRISAGLPLRTDMLRSASSVMIGQTVKVIAVGTNFTISSEGSVLNNAAPGQLVRVRTPQGQIITGVVKDANTVQIQI
ncbi:flagellar basal body P-ring formation chaperone FlgA [Paraburkholderia acidipaludis]|uniref:flagellar basal body P-ring formation chaperone FlgA n=1 Tax=Paraburkholderia acidipaludis TaxID=660537 RepID=UPI000A633936|nr:flagellar basal body P-ring formation chaperone FlgA [Paraburkholderia acidipaludis]